MTDLEITRLCADAMGITFKVDIGPPYTTGAKRIMAEIEAAKKEAYDPLYDDAQAMALVKKLGLGIYCDEDNGEWGCYKFKTAGPDPDVTNTNLNRAICKCVAKMQAEK